MNALVSWSGGKDSCLAAHIAIEQGARLSSLLCMMEPGGAHSRSHGLPSWVLRQQASAMGIDLRMPQATWSAYEATFVAELQAVHAEGTDAAVFGDIDLQPHRDWEEQVCARAGMTAFLPLWSWPRERVVREVFERGIEAMVVCVDTRWLPPGYCGRRYDAEFVNSLPPGVDACGERGEFHTCVVSAPLFRHRLELRVASIGEVRTGTTGSTATYCFANLTQGECS